MRSKNHIQPGQHTLYVPIMDQGEKKIGFANFDVKTARTLQHVNIKEY